MGFYAKIQVYQIGIVVNEVGLKGAADISPAAGPSLTLIGFESVSNTQSMKPGSWSQPDALEGNQFGIESIGNRNCSSGIQAMASDVNGVAAIRVIGGRFKMILITIKQMNPVPACLSQGTGESKSGGTGSDDGNVNTQSGIQRGALQRLKPMKLNPSRTF
jgi:hypothetical protein